MFGENTFVVKHRRLLVAIVCLLLLLLASSILLVTTIKGSRGNSPYSAHRRGSAGSTVTPGATPSIFLTPTPLFSDDFSNNSKGWAMSKGGYTRSLDQDQLTLSATNHQILTESLPTSTTFSDFTLITTFTFVKGDAHDSVGLYLRGDSNLDHDYRIDIFGNNTYVISKESLDVSNIEETMTLINPTRTSHLLPTGQANTLTVMMKGSSLVLQINGATVESITDTDYTHGQIALFVENGATSDGVTATFSHIEVNPAPDQVPAQATPTAQAKQ